VRLVGSLGHFNGLLQFNLSASNAKHVVEVLSTGNPLPAPVALDFTWPITTTDLTATSPGVASAEANEGRLVRVDNVLVDTATGANFASGSNVTVTDAADSAKTFVLRIDSRVTEVIGQPKPTTPVSLVGVLGQFDNADPRAGGYQLIVTRLADVISGVVHGRRGGRGRHRHAHLERHAGSDLLRAGRHQRGGTVHGRRHGPDQSDPHGEHRRADRRVLPHHLALNRPAEDGFIPGATAGRARFVFGGPSGRIYTPCAGRAPRKCCRHPAGRAAKPGVAHGRSPGAILSGNLPDSRPVAVGKQARRVVAS
jgi:hypothetical protein